MNECHDIRNKEPRNKTNTHFVFNTIMRKKEVPIYYLCISQVTYHVRVIYLYCGNDGDNTNNTIHITLRTKKTPVT